MENTVANFREIECHSRLFYRFLSELYAYFGTTLMRSEPSLMVFLRSNQLHAMLLSYPSFRRD